MVARAVMVAPVAEQVPQRVVRRFAGSDSVSTCQSPRTVEVFQAADSTMELA
jgi:hypothetical protein